ncbi:glutathione S-transferase family protein [Microvirgula aerodenitrificans]|uniref:glutathione S-transferase family protein n=1 Tax=Microvirgula aerodenitrificans TaxID=57480 RepID=UPI00048E329A|nr:glutathione S-transferase [Microvirgula aerodenitrificans]
MIKLHHLNHSRSIRALWLLEEIGLPYELVAYRRDPQSHFAPPALAAIHPLGKSPVIELDGQLIAESGAMTEVLIERFAPHLAPDRSSADHAAYLQWIHFAESSAMLPLLLKIFSSRESAALTFLPGYAQQECDKVLGYLESSLAGRTYLLGERLSGADFMMVFVAELALRLERPENYPNLQRYVSGLRELDSWKRAQQVEQQQYSS